MLEFLIICRGEGTGVGVWGETSSKFLIYFFKELL